MMEEVIEGDDVRGDRGRERRDGERIQE